MHNRLRMLTASYLTKHLLTDWRVGEAWFRECLTDWDVANNAVGWQWTAGSGPDAAPFFRIFNPATQAQKFDPDAAYRGRFLAEGRRHPHADALAWFEAVPRSWDLSRPALPRAARRPQGRARACPRGLFQPAGGGLRAARRSLTSPPGLSAVRPAPYLRGRPMPPGSSP